MILKICVTMIILGPVSIIIGQLVMPEWWDRKGVLAKIRFVIAAIFILGGGLSMVSGLIFGALYWVWS